MYKKNTENQWGFSRELFDKGSCWKIGKNPRPIRRELVPI